MKYHYSYRRFTYPMMGRRRHLGFTAEGPSGSIVIPFPATSSFGCDPMFGDTSQVGSLAGAAHLLHINAGVLRQAQ